MKGAIFVTLEKYLSVFFISMSFFILAKFVSVENVGEFSAIEAIVMICALFSLLSLDTVFQDYYIKNSKSLDIGSFYFSCFMVKVAFSLLGYIFSILIIYSLGLDMYYGFIISTLIVLKTTTIFTLYNVTVKDEKRYFIIGVTSTIISFSLKLCILTYGNEAYMPTFFIVDFLILFVFSGVCFYLNSLVRETYLLLVMSIVKNRFFFILSSFSVVAFGKVDQILLAKFLSFEDVANYSLAMKMIGLFVMVSSAFNLTFSRDLAINSCKNQRQYIVTIKKLMLSTFFLGSSFCIANYIISPHIIELVYGDKYLDAIYIVKGLTPLILLIFLSSSLGRILIVEELGKLAFLRNILALFFNITLNLLLIPDYGIKAVLFSAIVSWTLSVVVVFSSNKIRNIFKGLIYV